MRRSGGCSNDAVSAMCEQVLDSFLHIRGSENRRSRDQYVRPGAEDVPRIFLTDPSVDRNIEFKLGVYPDFISRMKKYC